MIRLLYLLFSIHLFLSYEIHAQNAQCSGTFGEPIVNITFGQGNNNQSSYSPLSTYAPGLVNFTTFQPSGSLAGQNVSALVKNASVFGP